MDTTTTAGIAAADAARGVVPSVGDLADAVRWRARDEWVELSRMLDYREAELARIESVEGAMLRQVQRSAIATTIAEVMHLSEGQVHHRLCAAERVRDQAPVVWQAFSHGVLDWSRVREIAATIDTLQLATSIHRLEGRVVSYAAEHTVAELRRWLARFVERVEADLATARAEEARAARRVSIRHRQDGMGTLHADLPSHQLAAIEARLRAAARTTTHTDPDTDADADVVDQSHGRTVAQREADQLVAWCLTDTDTTDTDTSSGAGAANIAVMIDADVLAGAIAGFAESADGRWAVPAAWIADIIASGNVFWHRIVTAPVTGDILTHEYLSRFAPDTLKAALLFLHGTCQSPGCMVPADQCDMDHRKPWPHGPTTADNLGPLCRRHHIMKGHGILRWTTAA